MLFIPGKQTTSSRTETVWEWWPRSITLGPWPSPKCQWSESCSVMSVCDSTDSTVHGILQARILEWVAVPFSRGSSQPRDRTQVSCIARRILYQLSHRGSPVGGLWQPSPDSCVKTSCCWSGSQFTASFLPSWWRTMGGGLQWPWRGERCPHWPRDEVSGPNCQRLVSFSETYRKWQVEIKGSKFNKNANSFSHKFLIIWPSH